MKIKIVEVKEKGDFLFVKVEIDSKIRDFSFPKSYQVKDKITKKPFWLHELKSMLNKSVMKQGSFKKVNNEFINKEFDLEKLEDLSPKALFLKCQKKNLKYLLANPEKLAGEVWVKPDRSYADKDRSKLNDVVKIKKKRGV